MTTAVISWPTSPPPGRSVPASAAPQRSTCAGRPSHFFFVLGCTSSKTRKAYTANPTLSLRRMQPEFKEVLSFEGMNSHASVHVLVLAPPPARASRTQPAITIFSHASGQLCHHGRPSRRSRLRHPHATRPLASVAPPRCPSRCFHPASAVAQFVYPSPVQSGFLSTTAQSSGARLSSPQAQPPQASVTTPTACPLAACRVSPSV